MHSHVCLLDLIMLTLAWRHTSCDVYPQGGMVYSNAVTTVSPTYANEVLNGGQAGWLRSTLLRPEVKSKVGVLDGLTLGAGLAIVVLHCVWCLHGTCVLDPAAHGRWGC